MGRARKRAVGLIACWVGVHLACGGEANVGKQAAEVYARATNQFAAALFLKPAGATNADLACQFAPLFIQQSSAGLHAAGLPAAVADVPASSFVIRHPSLSSALVTSNDASGAAQSHPAVFYATDSVQLKGHAHVRFSYQWCYSFGHAPALRTQGVRIVLDARGQPAVWEILADTSGLRLIFVSQSVEAAAAAEFGKPPPGRRFAIERGLDQAPDVVVPRVIDDGPVPMGPIIYLSEGTRNVSTLICRCMPAQVKQLIATQTFDLAPVEGVVLDAFLATAAAVSNAPPLLWATDQRVENRLDHCLRLPSVF